MIFLSTLNNEMQFSIFQQCILTDVLNKIIFRSEDLETFNSREVPFVPSYISFHPFNATFALAYDKYNETVSGCF